MSEKLTLLHDEEMIAVSFYEDKVQLSFHDYEIHVFAKLCELIGESIAEVSSNKTHFTFVFKNKTKLLFELSMPDDPCPEVAFGEFGGQLIAFMNEHGED